MDFLWFSNAFQSLSHSLIVLPLFSSGLKYLFLLFSDGFPDVFSTLPFFSIVLQLFDIVSMAWNHFSYCFPSAFLWLSDAFHICSYCFIVFLLLYCLTKFFLLCSFDFSHEVPMLSRFLSYSFIGFPWFSYGFKLFLVYFP